MQGRPTQEDKLTIDMHKRILGHAVPGTARRDSTAAENHESASPAAINGVIYCRVSSKEQIEGTSLESQEIACREYAESHQIKIVKTFVERGESAKVADRTQLVELIDFCRTSETKVHALLVWKLDRFARNVGDHFNIKATLMRYGVRVVSVTEPIDANPEGKLMETILAGFAQFDNDIRATRTVQGMRRKIQEGIFPWKPPLGYKSPAREGAKKTAPDEPNQPLFGLLQKSWRAFATGMYKKADVIRLMNSWGVQTESGISMTPQSIDNFFRNPYYAGILVDPWSGKEYAGKQVPMISPADFERVQVIMSKRSQTVAHQKERQEFPLRGVARCAVCRQYVTGGFSKGRSKRYPYYRCDDRECQFNRSYPTQVVDGEYAAFLGHIAPESAVITSLGERILRAAERRQVEANAQVNRKKRERERFDNQIQELIRLRARGLITDQELVKSRAQISRSRPAVEDTARAGQFDLQQIHSALEEIAQPLSELRATWANIPVGFQRRFNHMVVPVGFVIGESRTAEIGPLFRLLGGLGHPNSHEVPLKGENLNRVLQAIHAFAEFFRSVKEEKWAS